MQCLYCGKELAFLKRLTGSEFCSDAHKRSYQDEYNRLAVSRLLQAQPKADSSPTPLRANRYVQAEAPEFLAGGKRAIEAPRPEPEPEPVRGRVFYQAPAVSEPEPVPAVEPSLTHQEPVVESRPQDPAPHTAEATPELVPAGSADFIHESLSIRDSELQEELRIGGPSELPGCTHYPSFHPVAHPVYDMLPMAALVSYEARLALWPGEAVVPVANTEVKEFSTAALSMDVLSRPAPPRGLRSAERVRWAIASRKAPDPACTWQTETPGFTITVTFRETTRSGSPAEIGFPIELNGLATALQHENQNPPEPAPETAPEAVAEPDSGPRAALEALTKLKEEEKAEPARRGKRSNGTQPAQQEAEPVVDSQALEWLFTDRAKRRPEPEHRPKAPGHEPPEEEPLSPPGGAPIHLEPAEAELAAVASGSDLAVALKESPTEAVPAEVREAAPELPKTSQFVTVPVKVFVPSKARLAPGSQSAVVKPHPELPRIEAQPLRPMMALAERSTEDDAVSGSSPNSSIAEAPARVEEAPPDQVAEAAPDEPDEPPQPAPSGENSEKAALPVAEPAPKPKSNVWKTTTILKTEDPAPVSASAPAKKEPQPSSAPQEEPEISVRELSFTSAGSSSFWSSLPLAARITILAIVLVTVGAVVYLTSFAHKTTVAADEAGPSIIMGEGGWVTDWAGDATGLHRGRQITIYKPSLTLSDYRISFQGRIENSSIGWVFRAADASNYYVMKLTQASSGFKLIKYSVVSGQEHEQASVAAPQPTAGWFSIRVDVRGPKFTTFIDGKPIDVWTDEQLKTGGVGFLNDRGERADIKGIGISYLSGVGK